MHQAARSSLALLLLLVLLVAACAKSHFSDGEVEDGHRGTGAVCTLLACLGGFEVTLSANDQELPDGNYDVWAMVDGVRVERCHLFTRGGQTTRTGDCQNVSPTLYGGKRGIGSIVYSARQGGEISTLHVAFIKEGQWLAERELQPIYQNVFPNGEACGGACRAAESVQIALDL